MKTIKRRRPQIEIKYKCVKPCAYFTNTTNAPLQKTLEIQGTCSRFPCPYNRLQKIIIVGNNKVLIEKPRTEPPGEPAPKRREWTDEEVERLKSLILSNHEYADICGKLDRPIVTIRHKLIELYGTSKQDDVRYRIREEREVKRWLTSLKTNC